MQRESVHYIELVVLLLALASAMANRFRGREGLWPHTLRFLSGVDLLVVFGLFGFFGGATLLDLGFQARRYAAVDGGKPLQMIIDRIEPAGRRGLFPIYVAQGHIEGESASIAVEVRPHTYLHQKPGDRLVVFATNRADLPYVWGVIYEEACPLVRLPGIAVSWRALAGLFVMLGPAMLLWMKLRSLEDARKAPSPGVAPR